MKCHYYKKAFIPYCWPGVIYGPSHCICETGPKYRVMSSGYIVTITEGGF